MTGWMWPSCAPTTWSAAPLDDSTASFRATLMLKLHGLLSDHAVFQRGKEIVVSGKASPGSVVGARFLDEDLTATADAAGDWSVAFAAREAGGPHEFSVECDGHALRRTDWMIGEVWLCSGQSNMEWTLAMIPGGENDIACADSPGVRCFTVPRIPAEEPAEHTDGRWEVASPETAGSFSAVAWFFARELSASLGCAVGVIVPAFGGTRIASWLPAAVLAARPEYAPFFVETSLADAEELQPHKDAGRDGSSIGWELASLDDQDWQRLQVPGFWQEQGWQLNGAVWYRQLVGIPDGWRGRELILRFGACDDFDMTFVNGVRVGGIGPGTPGAYATPREYPVPPELTRDGTLVIAVRIFDEWGFGGIVRSASLRPTDSAEEVLSLEGEWRARVETAYPLRTSSRPIPAAVLYNGMICPLRKAALRGFLWYQGESDVERAGLYRQLLSDLIVSWRKDWNDPGLAFGIVQLANYKAPEPHPGESDWAELREAQLKVSCSIPNAGMAVTIDTGEVDNIHPRLKRPVGERLAHWALTEVYDRPEESRISPFPDKHWIDGNSVYVRFLHAGAGLRSRDSAPLTAFQIAGADRKWMWAEAQITAPDTIRVIAQNMAAPVAVRYGWQNNPNCNLENPSGLPASPFRTDQWPTGESKPV